jgi:hypothetical protein
VDSYSIQIEFPDVSSGEAGRLARSLADAINAAPDLDDSTRANLVRSDPSALDLGATIVLILGAPAVVVVANAIKKYLERRADGVDIVINGVRISNPASRDAAAIVSALQHVPGHVTERPAHST